MRRSELSAVSLILAAHTSCAYALVAKPASGSAFSLDIVPAPVKDHSRRAGIKFAQYDTVDATISESQTAFFSPVVIGNQTFQMLLDTGSPDLWVYSDQASKKARGDHVAYTPSPSATLLQNHTWAIKYSGGNSASGIVYTDTVKLGDVFATNQAVEAAIDIPFYIEPDGIMGLGSGKLNQVKPFKQKTFFESVAPSLDMKLFAAAFVDKGVGAWDFGYLNESRYTGDIVYTPNVQPDKYWTMAVGSYSFGDGDFEAEPIGNAIVDSGSTNVNLPLSVVEGYFKNVPAAVPVPNSPDNAYYFPCNTTLPDFHFKVENTTFTLTGDMINDSVFFRGYCLGLLRSNVKTKHTILGNTFMKHFYVVFSAEEEILKLGIAKRADWNK